MIVNENNKKYKIIICKDAANISFMIQYIEKYLKLTEERIIGIDFEFNRVKNSREVALCQINMEIEKINEPYIFMFYPPDIMKISNIFIELLTNVDIIKVLHGSESLDVPYLFSDVLTNEIDRYKFCQNLYDTRFMCDYHNISMNKSYYKCTIYELLKQMNVINQNKYDYLEKNDKDMGDIWKIKVDVKNMNDNLIIYCLYDVIYLPTLFYTFPINNIYRNLLPAITNYNMIIRFNGSLDILSLNISKYNNTKIYDSYNYNDIYLYVTILFEVESIVISNLLKINYLKKFFEYFIKNIIYMKLSNKYKNSFILDKNNVIENTIIDFGEELNLIIMRLVS
jgi:hypothetical protein